MTYPVIVCIAKREHDYIEEFVKYHINLGFKHIYLYDNEDVPTYESFLQNYKDYITVIHLPFNNYHIGVQYIALGDFTKKYLKLPHITHVAHIDIDEFICLKKHANICEFIEEYIVGDCQAIGMNWRFFGSSGRTEKSDEPNTLRFTMCEKNGNQHIKTLFKTEHFVKYEDCHSITLSSGYTKATNGEIINGPFNFNIDFNVIQLNHYKCKTLPEFRYIRTRQRADTSTQSPENLDDSFNHYDKNEVEDLTACYFYISLL
jgi:hypothetical protein